MDYYKQIDGAAEYIFTRIEEVPRIGLVLGTGLSGLANELSVSKKISFSSIPHFPAPTVMGHRGEILAGSINNIPLLAQNGRLHYYEGFEMKQICFSIRVMARLGIKKILMASAVGGLNKNMRPGDIGLITDHINLFPENPLHGPNDERLGQRYPDMSRAYSKELNSTVMEIALDKKIAVHPVVYAGLAGPSLETPAEYKYLSIIGADVVGMSTVPEVIVANHAGIEVCAFAAITNCCHPDVATVPLDIQEIFKNAAIAEQKIHQIVRELIQTM